MYGIFLLSDWWGRVQTIMSGVTPGLVVLEIILKQSEQGLRRKLQ